MSFSLDLKNELSIISSSNKDEIIYELKALFDFNKHTLTNGVVVFSTGNKTASDRLSFLYDSLYSKEIIETKRIVNNRVIKYDTYIDNVNFYNEYINKYEDIEKIDETLKYSYLRGAYISSGSISDPKKSEYHMEIYNDNSSKIVYLQNILNSFELNSKITKRRNGYICYLKKADNIILFVQMLGSQEMYMEYESIKTSRDVNNLVSRRTNCDVANSIKTIENANEQIRLIEYIESKYDINSLDEKLRQVITIRKENDSASLKELVELYCKKYNEQITKSGLNHRLNRLKELFGKKV
ncbi:MAG: DNA-binding protein WhiA [Acholeplasmatales bacterium]|jgi:DNA-binding protein WhiA|nr:DNA-binding protein WhiA [Acholeplasmatales bacterium]